MDQDYLEDTLAEDMFGFSSDIENDFDTSDLMDILEPDYLENSILLDDEGALESDDIFGEDEIGAETVEQASALEEGIDASLKARAEESKPEARQQRRPSRRDRPARQEPEPESLSALSTGAPPRRPADEREAENRRPKREDAPRGRAAKEAKKEDKEEDLFGGGLEPLSAEELEQDLATTPGASAEPRPEERAKSRPETRSEAEQRRTRRFDRYNAEQSAREAPADTPAQAPEPERRPERRPERAPEHAAKRTPERAEARSATPVAAKAAVSSSQLRRHFDATPMIEASDKLQQVLKLPEIPAVIFLGRAAERCLEALPNHRLVTIAELNDEGFVPVWDVPQQESFRRVLMAKNEATHSGETDLMVSDISELELDEISLPLEGTHLLLTRLQPDPNNPDRIQGTLTLIGQMGLRSGATFLKQMKEHLEAPITLMV